MTFPDGIYLGTYKGVRYYAKGGDVQFLLGWVPNTRRSLRAAKVAITKWRNQND